MSVSDEIKERADKLALLSEAIQMIESKGLNGNGRRMILLLLKNYSNMPLKECYFMMGYACKESGWKASKSAEKLINDDWDCRKIYDEAVRRITGKRLV